jgi:serine/threonine protein kinase
MQRLKLHEDHTNSSNDDNLDTAGHSWMLAGGLPEERFNEVEYRSPPSTPLDFPAPIIHYAERSHQNISYLHHIKQQVVCTYQTFLVSSITHAQLGHVRRGYLFKRKVLAKSAYSAVYLCAVLHRREKAKQATQLHDEADWVSTDQVVAVEVSPCVPSMTRQPRHAVTKSLNNEVAARQHIGGYHPNVLGCIEVLRHGNLLYTVMPYCCGGDLYHRILEGPDSKKTIGHLGEDQARISFRQLLLGLAHLQKKGVCHCAISLENILLDENQNLVITDFALALRVPYTQLHNSLGISDVSEGSLRRLIRPQLGKNDITETRYMSPELLAMNQAFDGYAADLWSSAVVLFILLVGWAPFRRAKDTDGKYVQIAMQGKLRQLLWKSNVHHVSSEAINLLQGMLRHDPRKRLSLADVMTHPWVTKPTQLQAAQPPHVSTTSASDSSLPLQRSTSKKGLLAQLQNNLANLTISKKSK